MDPRLLARLNAARRAREAAILVTPLGDGAARLVLEGEAVDGALGEGIEKAFRTGQSRLTQTPEGDVFLNVHVPAPRIVVIGAVHISQALAPIAAIAGYALEIIDPRTAFATPERFEGVKLSAEWPEEVIGKGGLDRYTALVAVTHDPKIDDWPIAEALRRNCFYVGALGSRKTHARRLDRLQAQGITPAMLERIHAPIGVDIGASSPQEIAIAIMAEIIGAFRRRGLGAPDEPA